MDLVLKGFQCSMALILVFKSVGVMDRSNDMQRVRRSLEEGGEMVSK